MVFQVSSCWLFFCLHGNLVVTFLSSSAVRFSSLTVAGTGCSQELKLIKNMSISVLIPLPLKCGALFAGSPPGLGAGLSGCKCGNIQCVAPRPGAEAPWSPLPHPLRRVLLEEAALGPRPQGAPRSGKQRPPPRTVSTQLRELILQPRPPSGTEPGLSFLQLTEICPEQVQ